MKTKLVVRTGIVAIKFDETSFFNTILGLTPGWDYKLYNEYISQKIVNLSITKKIHIKSDIIDGFILSGSRQPTIFGFILDKPSGCKVFCASETIQYRKIN